MTSFKLRDESKALVSGLVGELVAESADRPTGFEVIAANHQVFDDWASVRDRTRSLAAAEARVGGSLTGPEGWSPPRRGSVEQKPTQAAAPTTEKAAHPEPVEPVEADGDALDAKFDAWLDALPAGFEQRLGDRLDQRLDDRLLAEHQEEEAPAAEEFEPSAWADYHAEQSQEAQESES